jgi:hypothetical protein
MLIKRERIGQTTGPSHQATVKVEQCSARLSVCFSAISFTMFIWLQETYSIFVFMITIKLIFEKKIKQFPIWW